ncbi:hypothetical protein OROHE_025411 [Orobanche hederae]
MDSHEANSQKSPPSSSVANVHVVNSVGDTPDLQIMMLSGRKRLFKTTDDDHATVMGRVKVSEGLQEIGVIRGGMNGWDDLDRMDGQDLSSERRVGGTALNKYLCFLQQVVAPIEITNVNVPTPLNDKDKNISSRCVAGNSSEACMQGIMFDHIQNLDKSRSNWRLKARLTRFWPTFSHETNAIRGYNLILLDDDNSHVHAYVYPDNWRAIGKEVIEGVVYIIENFQVRDTIRRLKPVSTKLCIRLLSSTTIESVENDAMIPLHKFEFMDLSDLVKECNKITNDENPEFAVDLIGVIKDFHGAKQVPTRYGDRDQARFKLSDGSVSHRVTILGDLANSVTEKYTPYLEQPVIGILTSAKLSTFRDWLLEEGYKTPVVTQETTFGASSKTAIVKSSFKDLAENYPTYAFKRNVMVSFTINKVEDEDNWWYYSSIVCHKEVEKIEKKFKCPECKRDFPYSEKRFRVFVVADDTTLATNVILLDRVVKRMVGTTVANILNDLKKGRNLNIVSTLFKQITGKEVTAVAQLSDSNISGDNNLYEIVDFCDYIDLENTVVEASPAQASNSFNINGEVAAIDLFQTPGSFGSVSKKIKVEDTSI